MVVGVMCDSLVVEYARREASPNIGRLQTNANLCFAVGGLLGTVLSGALPQYCLLSPEQIFLVRATAPQPNNGARDASWKQWTRDSGGEQQLRAVDT